MIDFTRAACFNVGKGVVDVLVKGLEARFSSGPELTGELIEETIFESLGKALKEYSKPAALPFVCAGAKEEGLRRDLPDVAEVLAEWLQKGPEADGRGVLARYWDSQPARKPRPERLKPMALLHRKRGK